MNDESQPIVKIRGLKFLHETKAGRASIPGLDLPHLSVSPGRIYALIGGSGCGKSLLLSLLATFPPKTWREPVPHRNESFPFSFSFFGEEFSENDLRSVQKYSAKMQAAVERSRGNIWYLPQNLPSGGGDSVPVEKTLVEIVRATTPEKPEDEILCRAGTFFENLNGNGETFFDWETLRKKAVRKLSGGERKRFEICARIIALNLFDENGKALFLLDEPTAGLDCVRSKKFFEFIREVSGKDRDVAFVIATHDLQFLDACANEIISVRKDDKDDTATTDVVEDKTCCEIFCGSVEEYKKTFGNEDEPVLKIFERNNGKDAGSAGKLQGNWLKTISDKSLQI